MQDENSLEASINELKAEATAAFSSVPKMLSGAVGPIADVMLKMFETLDMFVEEFDTINEEFNGLVIMIGELTTDINQLQGDR